MDEDRTVIYARDFIATSHTAETLSMPKQQPVHEENKYSARINRLRRLCGREISSKDIQEDERLAYLINK